MLANAKESALVAKMKMANQSGKSKSLGVGAIRCQAMRMATSARGMRKSVMRLNTVDNGMSARGK